MAHVTGSSHGALELGGVARKPCDSQLPRIWMATSTQSQEELRDCHA